MCGNVMKGSEILSEMSKFHTERPFETKMTLVSIIIAVETRTPLQRVMMTLFLFVSALF